MNICGCLVHAAPEKVRAAEEEMNAMDGVEVHGASADGRFIVVVEDTPERFASDAIMALHQVPGVLSLTLTYHHFEDIADAASGAVSPSMQSGAQTNDHL